MMEKIKFKYNMTKMAVTYVNMINVYKYITKK